jgi:hypothetical protein
MPSFILTEVPLLPERRKRERRRRNIARCILATFIAVTGLAVILIVTLRRHKQDEQQAGNFSVAFHKTDYDELEKPVRRQERRYGKARRVMKMTTHPVLRSPCVSRPDVVALQVPIVYNKYGDVDPNGLMFALEGKERAERRVDETDAY